MLCCTCGPISPIWSLFCFLLWEINNFLWLLLNNIVCGYVGNHQKRVNFKQNTTQRALLWKKINQNITAKSCQSCCCPSRNRVCRDIASQKINSDQIQNQIFFFNFFVCVRELKKSYDASTSAAALVKHSPDKRERKKIWQRPSKVGPYFTKLSENFAQTNLLLCGPLR